MTEPTPVEFDTSADEHVESTPLETLPTLPEEPVEAEETTDVAAPGVDGHGSAKTTVPFTLPVGHTAQYLLKPTVDDARGTERIAGPSLGKWTPAPVDPDPADITAYEKFVEDQKKARQARLQHLGLVSAPNTPPNSALDLTSQGTTSPDATPASV